MTLTMLLIVALAQTPAKVDLSAKKTSLVVLTDGQKHYLVLDAAKPLDGEFYYGDAKTLAKLRVVGGGAQGTESFDVTLWDPRYIRGSQGSVDITMKESGKTWEVTCGKKVTAMKKLEGDEAVKFIEAATFTGHSWTRMPDRLLRDDKANYYFVDRLRTEDQFDRRDFRLFIGPRGKAKLQPLKDVVDDTEGMIFAAKNGELRLVANKGDGKALSLKWVSGKTEMALTEVPLDDWRNARLVYMELGPYEGARIGTPCDDLN